MMMMMMMMIYIIYIPVNVFCPSQTPHSQSDRIIADVLIRVLVKVYDTTIIDII